MKRWRSRPGQIVIAMTKGDIGAVLIVGQPGRGPLWAINSMGRIVRVGAVAYLPLSMGLSERQIRRGPQRLVVGFSGAGCNRDLFLGAADAVHCCSRRGSTHVPYRAKSTFAAEILARR